jgi:hypothetical protein
MTHRKAGDGFHTAGTGFTPTAQEANLTASSMVPWTKHENGYQASGRVPRERGGRTLTGDLTPRGEAA